MCDANIMHLLVTLCALGTVSGKRCGACSGLCSLVIPPRNDRWTCALVQVSYQAGQGMPRHSERWQASHQPVVSRCSSVYTTLYILRLLHSLWFSVYFFSILFYSLSGMLNFRQSVKLKIQHSSVVKIGLV